MPAPPDAHRSTAGSDVAAVAQPLKVRHVVFDAGDSHDFLANGLYMVARQLVAEQVAAGVSARLVVLCEAGRLMPTASPNIPLEALRLEGARVLGRRIGLSEGLLDRLVADSAEPCFFHIHAARQPLLIALLRRLGERGIGYGITIHGGYSHLFDAAGRPRRGLPLAYLAYIERRLLERARFVQGLTPAECDIIRHLAPRARVVLLGNAAFSRRLDGTPPRPNRKAPSAAFPTFGSLGRYEPVHKGLDLLIEGFALYRRRGGTGRLEMAGTGPERETLERMVAAHGIADATRVGGPLFGEAKAQALATWDYFVAPSRFDGFPLGPTQAALSGLPLVLSAATGLKRHVEESGAGLIIDTLTPEAVADALARAGSADASAWVAMSAAAYRMALAFGDWSAVSDRLLALYRGG